MPDAHRRAASSRVRGNRTTLSGEVSPETISTSDVARPNVSATSARTSRFALPFSGGAFTDSLSAPPCTPRIRRREAPAETRRRRPVSYTHLRAHETDSYLVCRLLLE